MHLQQSYYSIPDKAVNQKCFGWKYHEKNSNLVASITNEIINYLNSKDIKRSLYGIPTTGFEPPVNILFEFLKGPKGLIIHIKPT